jgi:hypothetical protein
VADSLPGLGIVAAVLGNGDYYEVGWCGAERIGEKVAAALAGTFLGILRCYGVVGPPLRGSKVWGESDVQHLQALRVAIILLARRAHPFGRGICATWNPPSAAMPPFRPFQCPRTRRRKNRPKLSIPPDPAGAEAGSCDAVEVIPLEAAPGAWKVAYGRLRHGLDVGVHRAPDDERLHRLQTVRPGYSDDPRGYTRRLGAGTAGSGEASRINESAVQKIETHIEQALRKMPEFSGNERNIVFSVTGEELRIDLLDAAVGLLFVTGSPVPTAADENILKTPAEDLVKKANEMDRWPHRRATPSAMPRLPARV